MLSDMNAFLKKKNLQKKSGGQNPSQIYQPLI